MSMSEQEFNLEALGEDTPTDTAAVRQMREHIKHLEAEAKDKRKAEQRAAELEARLGELESERRGEKARAIFRDKGLPENAAELYVRAAEGEITPESVAQFAETYGLRPPEPSQAQVAAPAASFPPGVPVISPEIPAASQVPFVQPTIGGSPGAQQVYTRTELDQMLAEGKITAEQGAQLIAAGRVKLSSLEGGLPTPYRRK